MVALSSAVYLFILLMVFDVGSAMSVRAALASGTVTES